MTYEPSDKMVDAGARTLFGDLDHEDGYFFERFRIALRAAFAAAVEAKEAEVINWVDWERRYDGPALVLPILRKPQEGEK